MGLRPVSHKKISTSVALVRDCATGQMRATEKPEEILPCDTPTENSRGLIMVILFILLQSFIIPEIHSVGSESGKGAA